MEGGNASRAVIERLPMMFLITSLMWMVSLPDTSEQNLNEKQQA